MSNESGLRIDRYYKQLLEKHGDELNIFDSTSLNDYGMCPRKFFFQHELKIVPRGPEPAPLTLGKAVHSFIEAYTLSHDLSNAVDAYEREVELKKADLTVEKKAGGLITMMRYIDEYFDAYGEDGEFPPLVIDGEPMVEKGFAIDVGGGVLWGRIDRIARDDEDPDGYVVLDHKHTSGKITDQKKLYYVISNQMTNYMLATYELFGKPPTKAVVDLIRVTDEEPSRESKTGSQFVRLFVYRSEEELMLRKRELRFQIAVIQEARNYGICGFPKSAPSSCFVWYRPCEYLPLCMAQVDDLVTLVENLYEKNTWVPYSSPEDDQTREG